MKAQQTLLRVVGAQGAQDSPPDDGAGARGARPCSRHRAACSHNPIVRLSGRSIRAPPARADLRVKVDPPRTGGSVAVTAIAAIAAIAGRTDVINGLV